MPASFQSINQPGSAGTPQFAQTAPVVGGGAEAMTNLAGLGASVFAAGSTDRARAAKADAEKSSATALGGLRQTWLDIRQAKATGSDIDVTLESRMALSKFNVEHPELNKDSFKAYKEDFGRTPSGLDAREEAKLKLQLEAQSFNFGRQGADPAYNEEQFELYLQWKRQDKEAVSRIQQIQAQVQEGSLHESELKKTILGATKTIADTYSTKVTSSMNELVSSFESGSLTLEDAKLKLRQARNDVNREVSSFGKYAEDPTVKAYLTPINDSIKLAEDIISGKLEVEAINERITLNKARRANVFMSDPKTVDLIVVSELSNFTAGIQDKVTGNVLNFLSGATVPGDAGGGRVKPIDPTGMDDKEKIAVVQTLDKMLNDPKMSTESSKAHAIRVAVGMAEYLGRNGVDFEPGDRKLSLDLLSTPGVMDLLAPAQRGVVMDAFTSYLVEDVDKAVRENVTNVELPLGSVIDRAYILGGERKGKPIGEMADLTVADGAIFWSIKPQYRGSQSAQQAIRKLNKNIGETMTPAIQVQAKGLGIPFEKSAALFIPSIVGGEDDSPKKSISDGGAAATGGDDAGKAVAVDSSSPEAFISSILPTVEEVTAGTGVFSEVAAAQAILESGWGKSVKGDNFFGIKGKGQTITTHEVVDGERVKIQDEFKTYGGFSDSVKGYVDFLQSNPRYAEALNAGTPEEQAKALQDAGYATDPEYANKLITIMKRLNK